MRLAGQSRGGFTDGKGKGGANVMQHGVVDLQHGTVEKNLHSCIKGHYPKYFCIKDCYTLTLIWIAGGVYDSQNFEQV